jgi:phosphatidylglycerophosphate synthase
MGKLSDSSITKEGAGTESFYDFLMAKYITPYFSHFFKRLKIHNPNYVTFFSFFLILLSSAMLLNTQLISSLYYRLVLALTIQLSFILDQADGQLARILQKTSMRGAWLDRLLDRVGEFIIFLSCGIVAWIQTGYLYFLILGLCTGYALSAYTAAMTISDSILMRYAHAVRGIQITTSHRKNPVKKDFSKSRILSVLSKLFFFLNFGIGERYLYLSFFIVINRMDLMLYATTLLSTLRFLSISGYVKRKLMKAEKT